MQIEIIKYDYHGLYTHCPICSNKVDIEFRDYVEKHPMIWCWNCEMESKFVIDCSIEDIEDLSHNEKTCTKTFDLLLVKRIANDPDMYKFIDNYNKNNNTSFKELDQLFEYTLMVDEDKFNKQILDEVGVELNSYNIGDIQKKYPDYNLSHDSCYILIEVLEKDGSLTRMNFWGD